jgi:putative DNA primase/helicase
MARDGQRLGRGGGERQQYGADSRRIGRGRRSRRGGFYGLANGSGKARAARDGSLREPRTWRVLILSTAEIPIATKLGEDRGRKARAGQLVRMLDIPADRGKGFGAFDHGGPGNDAGALAKAFKQAAISDYGTAGPEFVRRIIASGAEEVRGVIRDFINALLK